MRREPTKGERIRKSLILDVREANDAERTILHTITARTVDRDGDVIEPRGARVDNFQKNPIVLFGHDSWAFPVGKNIALEIGDQAITALTQFAGDAQAHPQAETAYRLARDGFLKAWSIGFMPITWSEDKALPTQDGWWFKEWELYEYSLVPIPSNPDALSRMAKAYGLPRGATDKDLADALSQDRQPFWDVARSLQIAATQPGEAGEEAAELIAYQTLAMLLTGEVGHLAEAERLALALVADETGPDAASADEDAEEQVEGARLEAIVAIATHVAGGLQGIIDLAGTLIAEEDDDDAATTLLPMAADPTTAKALSIDEVRAAMWAAVEQCEGARGAR